MASYKISRSVSVLLSLVIFILMIPNTLIVANADYENTHTNTGNQRDDIVAVAETQIGYHEGANNETKYNHWLGTIGGYPANGYGYPWCHAFVSWCANQADISSDIVPYTAGTAVGRSFFVNDDVALWEVSASYGGGYVPRRGDIIYFGSGSSPSHVGIVTGCDGSTVYTVEGNSSDQVIERSYSLNNSYVIGYGVPDYENSDTPAPIADEPIAPYPRPTGLVKIGMKGDSVRWVQYALNVHLGYDIGESGIDGDFGDATETAVATFQVEHDLTPYGYVDEETRNLIVEKVQEILSNHDPEGYLDSAEGGYGTVTLAGWALDRDTPDEACEIHIYMDGPSGQGGTCIATGIMADQPSPDVASIIGVGGNHRYNATLNLNVTGNHTFYAYAINRGGGNHNPELNNHFTTYIYEKTNSVISNVYISSVTPSGFTVNVTVSDDTKIGRIAVPVWTTHKDAEHSNGENGQDDLLYNWQNLSLAKKTGTNSYVFDVSTLDHNDESGEYNIDVYAFSPDGSQIDRWCLETNHRTYVEVPSEKVLSNVSVTNLTPSGYTLQVNVTDDSNIGKIVVPVWTSYVAKETGSCEPGQDDLLSAWQDCSVAKQIDKNMYVFEVSTIEHNNESGEYCNDIYVYDNSSKLLERWCIETKHRTYVYVPAFISGDINSDGVCNISDTVLLQKWLLTIPNTHLANWKSADLNTDGKLNGFDLALMRWLLLETA